MFSVVHFLVSCEFPAKAAYLYLMVRKIRLQSDFAVRQAACSVQSLAGFRGVLKQAARFVCRELKVPLDGEFVLL